MTQANLVWGVIILALVAANLPFWSERFLLVRRLSSPKSLALRLAELAVAYLLVGAVAMAMEHSVGQNAPQGWEFYAVTVTLFLTLAFPGFVYRYLYKRH